MLEPHHESNIPDRVESPPPAVEIDGDLEYEVESILDSKVDLRRKSCPLMYLVKWLGYDDTDDSESWMSALDLENAQDAIDTFHKKQPNKPGPLGSLPSLSVLRAEKSKGRKR